MSSSETPQDGTLTTNQAWERGAKGVGVLVAALALLPAVVPFVVARVVGLRLATRARYWVVYSWWPLVCVAGIVVAALVHGRAIATAIAWSRDDAAATFALDTSAMLTELAAVFLPLAGLSLAAGVFLLPVGWVLHRRHTARVVMQRRVADVVMQESIETARLVAADLSTARRMSVKVNLSTGQIVGSGENEYRAPYDAGKQWAFGLLTKPTIRTARDKFKDTRTVRDWVDARGRTLVMPLVASAVRALLIAESGTGKTVLLNGIIFCALKMGWPVIMLDAKGDPDDADKLVQLARRAGHTAVAGGRWNLFSGTAEQITAKLMRLMPPPDGANQHYLTEARAILQVVQAKTPLTSIDDLRDRIHNPEMHVRDAHDATVLTAVVDSRIEQTAAERAFHSLETALRPLEPWIGTDGWNYGETIPQLRVVPLLPVDDAQAKLGDLLMVGLRHHMSTRLSKRDKSPLLVIVDEFPQLITEESDPGDTASSLFETARSAGMGLVLAAQSTPGLSNDETRRRRALSSGAALLIGRSKDPEDTVKYAGTTMRMEASGAATGENLNSARAQHTYVLPPQVVREAADGAFWLVQAGGIASFRAMPPAPAGEHDPTAVPEDVERIETPADVDRTQASTAHAEEGTEHSPAAVSDKPADAAVPAPEPVAPQRPRFQPQNGFGAVRSSAAVKFTQEPQTVGEPATENPWVKAGQAVAARAAAAATTDDAPTSEQPTEAAASEPTEVDVVGLEIEMQETEPGHWTATAWPADDEDVNTDETDPEQVTFATDARHPDVPEGEWWQGWHPEHFTRWGHQNHNLPPEWTAALDQLVQEASRRYDL